MRLNDQVQNLFLDNLLSIKFQKNRLSNDGIVQMIKNWLKKQLWVPTTEWNESERQQFLPIFIVLDMGARCKIVAPMNVKSFIESVLYSPFHYSIYNDPRFQGIGPGPGHQNEGGVHTRSSSQFVYRDSLQSTHMLQQAL